MVVQRETTVVRREGMTQLLVSLSLKVFFVCSTADTDMNSVHLPKCVAAAVGAAAAAETAASRVSMLHLTVI